MGSLEFLLPLVAYSSQKIKVEIKPGLEDEAKENLSKMNLTDWIDTYANDEDFLYNLDIENQYVSYGIDEHSIENNTTDEFLAD
jgi:tRNA A22 N-methylase